MVDGHMNPAGAYGFDAFRSNIWSLNVQKTRSLPMEKLSLSVEYPSCVIRKRPSMELETARRAAGAIPSGVSTLDTPLLPAESVGFTITGNSQSVRSASASSMES